MYVFTKETCVLYMNVIRGRSFVRLATACTYVVTKHLVFLIKAKRGETSLHVEFISTCHATEEQREKSINVSRIRLS
jgi:plasmid replication initiation protein